MGSRFHSYLLGWFSNRTGTSFDDGKARGKDETRLAVPNLPHSHWSTQLFDLRAPSSTDVPVLLLNQPIYFSDGTDSCSHYMYTKNGTKPIRYVTLRLRDRRGAARRGAARHSFARSSQKPLRYNRSCVWTEALVLFSMIFAAAQSELSSIAWTQP